MLEPQIPVQAGRVVLLDDEATVVRLCGGQRVAVARGLGCGAEVALGLVAAQLGVGHRLILPHAGGRPRAGGPTRRLALVS